ncbi:enoyl-CoA hydratase/isomerase family protein [Ruixingdingia sedimenti]|uniref:Enoyl-CoA hydratase/isomerase family protein n=1 Tax=Ruixingdingia sedimenti TaxID=3073604 RepID=A0ABU1F7L3_9RHOB|nr:enoyl-CoA hydratase/isomerase family protein [Xinfangfangia sp. LG-4]MDR5652814.1 enoyl-CoA hydratase/isomerase family protein [Xinfangfangia sp. LG-4]
MSGPLRLDHGAVMRLTLAAPRANALEPGLLDAIRRALDTVEAAAPEALLIAGGRNFCSGGDVARFRDAAREGRAVDYARQVVPVLQDIVLRLLALPCTVAVAARGAVTGGGAGFLFAADLAVVAPDCFVQPYYAAMGFAPDGGWTALLPERIGAGAALAWLAADRRVDAGGLVARGLAQAVGDRPEDRAADLLADTDPATRRHLRALVWDDARRAAAARRLDAETEAFMDMIARPETLHRMEHFLS